MAHDRGVGMSEAEINELLGRTRTLTLATIGPDGLPHLASMWFGLSGADLLMWTYGASQKARNLERDPRATVLAETGSADYRELRGVSLDCSVEILHEPERVLEVGRLIAERNDDEAHGGDELLRQQAAKRVALVLRVRRARSWDHAKLG